MKAFRPRLYNPFERIDEEHLSHSKMQIAHCDIQKFDEDGFVVIPQLLAKAEVRRLIAAIASAADDFSHNEEPKGHIVRRDRDLYAIRNLVHVVPAMHGVQQLPPIREVVSQALGRDALLVRTILFDKTEKSNWGVFWHQDVSIAVRERCEVAGFENWSSKAGVTHVQPPTDVLENMLTVRLHLDDCDESNGPLRVIPGSHRQGRLTDDDIMRWKEKGIEVSCLVPAGGALLFRPLLLHSSQRMKVPSRRRVLHLEFSACELPHPLKWASRDPIAPESASGSAAIA
ncbi:MAG: phytanoyl-CoA dioxygenase family protein [Planctomycetaceae bacterium]